VNDLAAAHARALDHLSEGGESLRVNLGTGIGISVKEIIAAVERVTGRTVPVVLGPRRAGDPAQLVADPTLALKRLQWKAVHTDINQTVESAWKWMNGPKKGRYNS
jgi:UDP-glucose 4-epimerase